MWRVVFQFFVPAFGVGCVPEQGACAKYIKLRYRELVLPPVPLAGNSSSHIWNGFFKHPLLATLFDLVQRILSAATLRSMLSEADGHLGNEKLHRHMQMLEVQAAAASGRPLIWRELFLCQNHQTNLASVPNAHGYGGARKFNGPCSASLPFGIRGLRALGVAFSVIVGNRALGIGRR